MPAFYLQIDRVHLSMKHSESFDAQAARVALDGVLGSIGLSWAAIEPGASEIVLFGSRATGVFDVHSDWDLLLVTECLSLTVHSAEIDLLCASPAHVMSHDWLQSELASHIAVYGRWLLGRGEWRRYARVSPSTADRKRAAIQSQLAQLRRFWPELLPGAQARHIRRLRREVQRLQLLREQEPIPPTHQLDRAWDACGQPLEDLEALWRAALTEPVRIEKH
jgi:hypothetical protein